MKINKLGSKSNTLETKKLDLLDKLDKNSNTNSINSNNLNTINSYCHLPPIDKNIKKLAMQKPTSILNKFIARHAKDIINYSERNINSPIKIRNNVSNLEDYKKSLGSKTNENRIIKSEEKIINSIKQRPNKKINKLALGVLLNNTGKNQKKEKLYTVNNELTNKDSLNFLNEDNYINININDSDKVTKKKSSIIKSIKRDSSISKENVKKLSKCFRRICTYQPDIKVNWKFRYGLKFNSGESNDYKIANNDIDYQSKIIDNHYRLLFNDINYYKKGLISDSHYLFAFENLSLLQKINYNKSLEETIGILVLLPKMLLNDIYDLINKSYSSKIPQMSKFEDKYVFDEVDNLKDNNKLFFEITDYFQDCYQTFQTVVKKIDKVLFKPNEFNKIISCFEKARFNISYINNSSENAIESYNKELELINRLKGKKNKSIKNLTEKLRENYSFKNNKEKQKKIRINNSLTDRTNNDLDSIREYLLNTPYKNYKVKSVINTRMMTDIMRHCREDSRLKISTHRINNEIDGENGEDLNKIKKLPPVIKMNLL